MARSPIATLTMLALCLMLGACASSSKTPPREKPVSLAVDDAAFATLGFRRDWTGFPIMSPAGTIRELYADTNHVIVQETGSTVSVLQPATGQLRWHDRFGSRLTKYVSVRPFIYAGTPAVLVTSESEIVIHQADTGNLLARQPLAKVVNTGPVLVGNIAIFGTASGEIMGHAIVPGARLWGHDLVGPIQAGPTYIDGVVCGVADSGQLASLDATTGALIGRGAMFKGATTAPVAGDQLLFVASLDQSVWAFDPFNPASPVWRFQTAAPLTIQPAAHAGVLYVSTSERGLVALEQATGRVLWENAEVRGEVICLHEGSLLVFHEGEAFNVSLNNGAILQRTRLPTVAGLKADQFVNGNLYAWGGAGGVARFVRRF